MSSTEKKPAEPIFDPDKTEPDQISQLKTVTTNLNEEQVLPSGLVQDSRQGFPMLESRNPSVQELIRTAIKIASSQAPVLLVGETGTGKEVLARRIHEQSLRAGNPFIIINCAAIPENLLESELFGYRRGAFTEAWRDKKGQLLLADGGTVLLDEIAEMSPGVQGKLLRFVQERIIMPLGTTTPIQLDVRILAATNHDLQEAISKGTFRKDLYYRLNVFQLELPPLRERAEDIPFLAIHFIERFNKENGTSVKSIADRTLKSLNSYSWPGNIRELENVVHRAVILAGQGLIDESHLPSDFFDNSRPIFHKSKRRRRVHQSALSDAVFFALQHKWIDNGHSGRLGQSVPFDHLMEFFIASEGQLFTPRAFAAHISPPDLPHRRDKLSNQILRALRKADIIGHNGRRAQAARYYLKSRFVFQFTAPQETDDM